MVLKRDIAHILLSYAGLQISVSTARVYTVAAIGDPVILTPSCLILTSRTDFLSPITRLNIEHLGLRLRETFDAKRRPRTPWSHDHYLLLSFVSL